jgi:hypothetical protein
VKKPWNSFYIRKSALYENNFTNTDLIHLNMAIGVVAR